MRITVLLLAVLAVQPRSAAADGELASKKGRVAGIVQIGSGYRGIFPFDEEFCGETDPDKSYCVGRSPFTLDLGGAFGLTSSLEAMVSVGFGLEADFGATASAEGPHIVTLAPGLKLYLTELGPGELSATLELPIDLTSYDQADATDLGVRNRNAFEFPLARSVSAQLYFGETASWRRWFRFEVDVGLGVVVHR